MFKDKLRQLRKQQEFTQTEISNYLKIDQTTYSRYETGTTEPDIATIKKLANFFDVSIDYLLENDRTISDSDEIVDFNNFILNGRYTINSKFLNDKERQILNKIVNAFSEIREIER
ncbi:MAG: helix-turn-helix transcriptional regulator [Selenomonadaceae bacterium]|nr:helix-turn-helix transcriptional regulator [Selenomonadaceae bacterium]